MLLRELALFDIKINMDDTENILLHSYSYGHNNLNVSNRINSLLEKQEGDNKIIFISERNNLELQMLRLLQ